MKSKRRILIVSVIVLLIVVGAVGLYFTVGDGNTDQSTDITRSQLTGLEVEPEIAERPILAVIFNNSPEARPPTGLDSAGIVFETVTEGGITRYLAFFQEDMPEEVGPIRSLRPYFLDWAMGFDASFAHVGGSQPALDSSEERDAKSLNQFSYGDQYYRTNDRPAPHNMYANMEDLRNLQNELGHEQSQFDEIPRSDDNADDEIEAETITIDFSTSSYEAEFRYQSSDNSYTRYLAGEPHIDNATNEPISVKNVLVIRTGETVSAIGDGDALLFKDGDVQEVRWEKSSHEERIKILDEEGNEVPLNRGVSWFSVLPEGNSVSH